MLNLAEVFDAINRMLVNRFPDRTVYVNEEPQDFRRESFALFEDYTNMDDGGVDCVEFTLSYTIIGYLPKDRRGNVDRLGLIRLKNEVLNLFRSGRVETSDRSLLITEIKGEKTCYIH